MKFIKILQKHKKATDVQIKDFIYKNMSDEMLKGLEHDDPKVIKRALKLFGIDESEVKKAEKADQKSSEG